MGPSIKFDWSTVSVQLFLEDDFKTCTKGFKSSLLHSSSPAILFLEKKNRDEYDDSYFNNSHKKSS